MNSKVVLFILCGCFMLNATAQKRRDECVLNWKKIAEIPSEDGTQSNPGLAGPITGVCGSKALIVAGGSNFPDALPWKGGHKTYHSRIYILLKKGKDEFSWVTTPLPLLGVPVAYPANVEIPNGLLSIGGENDQGALKRVVCYKWKNRKLHTQSFPDLPVEISSAGAALIGNKVYLAGGISQNQPLNSLYCLDISDPAGRWTTLPAIPVRLSNAVVVSQNDGKEDCIYVIGGRYKSSADPLTTFSGKVFVFSPVNNRWREETAISDGGKSISLAAGTGVAHGKEEIILFGGDLGIIYNQTEQYNNQLAVSEGIQKQVLQAEKETLLDSHPGFYRGILVYNTKTHAWRKIEEAGFPVQATTTAFAWNKRIIIPQGEIRPGVRTPAVISITVKKKKRN
jgi:cyclically-permuted mutarotase family protein